ncbi:MAG: hypothetical protein KDH96_06990 [Candidatus Riesia sp.]|nr:hypothetical protein [Candidatus Riesia sp.]
MSGNEMQTWKSLLKPHFVSRMREGYEAKLDRAVRHLEGAARPSFFSIYSDIYGIWIEWPFEKPDGEWDVYKIEVGGAEFFDLYQQRLLGWEHLGVCKLSSCVNIGWRSGK